MVARWSKRVLWVVLMCVLVVAPARLAQGPARVEAGVGGATGAGEGGAAVAWVVLAGTVAIVPAWVMLVRAKRR